MLGSEVVWKRLGAVVEETASLRIRVLQQSRANQQLRREVDRQRELLAKIMDLERQNQLFDARIPQGATALRQHDALTSHTNLEGLLPLGQVASARCLWERHRMGREELRVEQQRRWAGFERERADRDMVPMLQHRVREAMQATEAANARIQELEMARAQVKEALAVDTSHLCTRLGLGAPVGHTAATPDPPAMKDPSALSLGGVFGLRASKPQWQTPGSPLRPSRR
jgi:hypothetical protein